MEKPIIVSKDPPLFSVIILSYLQEHNLERCLKSVLDQKYTNLELIVCDDCSPGFDGERLRELVDNQKSGVKRFAVFVQPTHVGSAANAQKGVELSNGDYFIIIDAANQLYDPCVISDISDLFNDENVNIIASRARAGITGGKLTDRYYPEGELLSSIRNISSYEQLSVLSTKSFSEIVFPSAVFFRRSLFDEIGGFDTSFIQEYVFPLLIRATSSGKVISFVDRISLLICSDDGSDFINEHYFNSVEDINRALSEYALPFFEKQGEKTTVLRCELSIWKNNSYVIEKNEWHNWCFLDRLIWKTKNCKRVILSSLFYAYENGINFGLRKLIYPVIAFFLLFVFHVKFVPGISFDRVWALLTVLSFLVFCLSYCCKLLMLFLFSIFKRHRRQK